MANYCSIDGKITGRRDNVQELLDMLCWEKQFKDEGLGAMYDCDYDAHDLMLAGKDDIVEVYIFGGCKWSVLCALREEYKTPSLESETERLNCVIELYSSEPGCQFQEHVLIDRGEVLIDDCVDYELYMVSAYTSLEEFNAHNKTDFAEDMIGENGDIEFGGYGEQYGIFQDFDAVHFEQGDSANE